MQSAAWARAGRLNVRVDKRRELGLAHRAHFGGNRLPALEEHQRGDAANIVFGRNFLVGIHVHLGDLELARILFRSFFEHWRNHFARAAPFSPVVHQHGRVGFENVSVKAGIGNVGDIGAHGEIPVGCGHGWVTLRSV